jgi:Secretion system C-terminal sorting domain
MKIKFKIVALLIIFAVNATAQTYFNRLYDYDGTHTMLNTASTSIELGNGDFLIGGIKFLPTFGALHFIRINANGDTILTKQYPKLNCGYYTAIGNSLIKCSDGNYAQAGAYSDSGSIYRNALLVKLTENGDTLWTKQYGGSNFDNANVVCQTPDSGFVLMGVTQSYSIGPASDFYLIKTDSLGNFQWQRTYGTSLAEDCVSGQITLDGGYILSGHRNNQLYLVKTDSNGNLIWEKVYAGTAGQAFVKQLADSTYIMVGAKLVSGLAYQAYMAKLSKTGILLWENTYGGGYDQQFYAIPIVLADGSIVCSGVSMNGSSPWGLLIKTDALGNQQWLRTYYANPTNANYVYDVKHTSDNGFILSGSGNLGNQDAWLVKVDSNGCEIANCNVGITEVTMNNDALTVYPNPAFNSIHISINNEAIENYNIFVVSVLGQVQAVETAKEEIDISALPAGIYFISVSSKDGKQVLSKKFIKE